MAHNPEVEGSNPSPATNSAGQRPLPVTEEAFNLPPVNGARILAPTPRRGQYSPAADTPVLTARAQPEHRLAELRRYGDLLRKGANCCYVCSRFATLHLWPPSPPVISVTTPRRSCGVWKQARRSRSSRTTIPSLRSSRFRVGGSGYLHQRSAANSNGWDRIPRAWLRSCGLRSPRRRMTCRGSSQAGAGRYVRVYRP